MNLQVLISTMQQNNYQCLLEKMNIQSDAIIVNQCDRNQVEELNYKGNSVRCLSFAERGVGLSRNNALMRASADICLFADEDVTYLDNYKNIILKAFENKPWADVIIFNVPSNNPKRPTHMITCNHTVRWYNCLRYGSVKIAVRTEKLKQANIYFSLLFGGGARYGAGEDSLFVADCVKKGLKVYTDTTVIGYVSQEDSSWFKGYTDKYFIDKGVFYRCLFKNMAYLLCIQYAVRHYKVFKNDKTIKEACSLMFKGVRSGM